MSVPGAGVLLALSGDDADILRVLSQAGSGLCVVRRCADLNSGEVAGADEGAHGLGGQLKLLGDVGDGQESCAHTTMIPLLDPLHNS